MSDQPDRELGRIADALERIAASLEYLEHAAAASRPAPRLRVSRGPGDRGGLPAVTLPSDGRLMVMVLNEGEVATELTRPELRVGDTTEIGAVIGPDGQPHNAGEVTPGSVVTVTFELRAHRVEQLSTALLVLRLPHAPGRFPVGSVLEVTLEPLGESQGRFGWKAVATRELVADA